MRKKLKTIDFLIKHPFFSIMLISRLFPLKKETVEKYNDKLDLKGLETNSILSTNESDDIRHYSVSCEEKHNSNECNCVSKLNDTNKYKDIDHEDEYIEGERRNDWIYLGFHDSVIWPWSEDVKSLANYFGIDCSDGTGNEIYTKIFEPVLNNEIVEEILKKSTIKSCEFEKYY